MTDDDDDDDVIVYFGDRQGRNVAGNETDDYTDQIQTEQLRTSHLHSRLPFLSD